LIALPPVVNISPALVNTTVGEQVKLSCLATGVGVTEFEYQWFLNKRPIPSQDTSTLIINSVTKDDSGNYTCSVINPYNGSGHSGVARLFVSGT